jgi:hypothetical protein
MTLIEFPRNVCVPLKYEPPLPRQRVFYLGIVYNGPTLCQEITRLYLKRHGKKNGTRKWSLITYEKYDEYNQREYSIELDNCQEDDVPKMLCQYFVGEHISIDDLKMFGWNGKINHNAELVNLFNK